VTSRMLSEKETLGLPQVDGIYATGVERTVGLLGQGNPPLRSKASHLRILSLSCVYPNPNDSGFGLFVRSRLRHVSRDAEIKVIAPVAQIDFATKGQPLFGRRGIPFQRWDEGLHIIHPAWIYPPGGYAINPVLLFLRLLPLAVELRKSFDFQLIDAHFAFPDGIAAGLLSKALGVPFTVTLRGSEVVHAGYAWRRKLMAWSLRRASRVITVSERLREFAISAGVDADKAKTIPNGVDSTMFFPRDREYCRRKHGILPNARVVLSAGTLLELKGHHRVARAVAGLRQRGLNLELIIAGREGRYESELRSQIADLGLAQHVRLMGEISPGDLAEVMAACDVFCLASSREGWPNVVHEAMACGAPVVATDVGAVKDLVASPDYGLVIPVGDGDALEQALFRAFEIHWDRESISAWAHSRTWDHVAQEVLSEFQYVANAAPKRSGKP
jgi:teichuronic acid biosynthesis glycosyltransferase TuaC